MKHTPTLMLALFGLTAIAPVAWALETPGQIQAVTVYRGQALVTRRIELPDTAGLHEIVVTNLPAQAIPGSIYAESTDDVQVRSVRYRTRPLEQDVRDEVRALDERIGKVEDELAAIASGRGVLQGQTVYLDKLEQFVAPTASAELTRGVLNADTLATLTEFAFTKRQKIAESLLAYQRQERALREQLDVLQRERGKITHKSARTAREAVVFANVPAAGGSLRLHYLVDHATWSPSYIARVGAAREQVLLEYYASIQQTSGEDWGDVEMTLSTATPSLVARAPELEPMKITLAQPVQAAEPVVGDLPLLKSLFEQRKSVEKARVQLGLDEQQQVRGGRGAGVAFAPGDFAQADSMLNRLADDVQILELARSTEQRETGRFSDQQSISVTYALTDRTSLPSRADPQMVQIAAYSLDASFYRLATPVLTSYVYEEADLRNESDKPLLAGPIATYLAGEFVGHGRVPTVTSGEHFTVGLGIDSSLRASRELVDRDEEIQGGNRVVQFTYRIAIENFNNQPAALRVMDRLPVGEESQIRVSLLDGEDQLSDDATYTAAQRKQGLLRWDVTAAPGATGPDATTLEFRFQLEYDKGMTIAKAAD